jgi:hypothetical protein
MGKEAMATSALDRTTEHPNRLQRDLRGSSEGVVRWNACTQEEREAAGPFQEMDLCGVDLSGVNLGSLNFSGAHFDGAKMAEAWLLESVLERASFRKTNLAKAWCAGARFADADFEGTTLAGCNLRTCDFRHANFAAADLQGASLDGADLTGADLTTANLTGATFRGAKYDEHTRWPSGTEAPDGTLWVGHGAPPLDFDLFVKRLAKQVDPQRLGRATEMLKAQSFQLYARVDSELLVGVVRSQTDPSLVYSCLLTSDGRFGCCTQNLTQCLGFPRGGFLLASSSILCKHLLVLLVGLAKKGDLDRGTVAAWVRACWKKGPVLDLETMTETLLRYKGAQTGDIDWRPTETIPEDYYAL